MNANIQAMVHQAAVLNRDGIASLSCGRAEKAHACFKNVLEIMGYITQMPDLPEGDASNQSRCLLEGLSPVRVPNFQNERFFIYNSAFMFQPRSSSFTQLDITLFSCAAIFNMALTYHQRALQAGTPGTFRIAARMYDQCMQIVNSLPNANAEGDNYQEEDQISSLLMIVCNNRAHIYYEMGDYEKSTEALERVRYLSQSVAQQHASGEDLAAANLILQDDAFEEIALNVLVTAPPATAPCA